MTVNVLILKEILISSPPFKTFLNFANDCEFFFFIININIIPNLNAIEMAKQLWNFKMFSVIIFLSKSLQAGFLSLCG